MSDLLTLDDAAKRLERARNLLYLVLDRVEEIETLLAIGVDLDSGEHKTFGARARVTRGAAKLAELRQFLEGERGRVGSVTLLEGGAVA